MITIELVLLVLLFIMMNRVIGFNRILIPSSLLHIKESDRRCFRNSVNLLRSRRGGNRAIETRKYNNNNNNINNNNLLYASTPLKCMIFIDGTWLYYSLIAGRTECPVKEKFGNNWFNNHYVDWDQLPKLIATSLTKSLNRPIDISRSMFFTSVRDDTLSETKRSIMISEIKQCQSIDAIVLQTLGLQEKCVDLSLAVEMLYYAMIPDSYDIGVLITGDKDFLPVMKKTRQAGKRVALCTMKNSCNNEMLNPDHLASDQVIWLEKFLTNEFIVPKDGGNKSFSKYEELSSLIEDTVRNSADGIVTSRNLGRILSSSFMDDGSTRALQLLKKHYRSLKKFLESNTDKFYTYFDESGDTDTKNFLVTLRPENDDNLYEFNNVLKKYMEIALKEEQDYTDKEENNSDDDDDDDMTDDDMTDDDSYDKTSQVNSGTTDYTEESLQGLLKLDLVAICQQNELPIRGTKAELIQLILSSSASSSTTTSSTISSMSSATTSSSPSTTTSSSSSSSYNDIIKRKKISDSEKFLLLTLIDILLKSPSSSLPSRQLGRCLVKLEDPNDSSKTVNDLLKAKYGSLLNCIKG